MGSRSLLLLLRNESALAGAQLVSQVSIWVGGGQAALSELDSNLLDNGFVYKWHRQLGNCASEKVCRSELLTEQPVYLSHSSLHVTAPPL